MNRSPGISVCAPESLRVALGQLAEGKNQSMSRVVRDLIERELAGSLMVVPLGPETKPDLILKAAEFGSTPEVLAKCLIRGGLRSMKGGLGAH